MKRVASHFVYSSGNLHPLHYVEWTDEGILSGIFPLNEEIAGTSFYDGILLPLPYDIFPLRLNGILQTMKEGKELLTEETLSQHLSSLPGWNTDDLRGKHIRLFLLDRHHYTSTELRANDGRGNSHI